MKSKRTIYGYIHGTRHEEYTELCKNATQAILMAQSYWNNLTDSEQKDGHYVAAIMKEVDDIDIDNIRYEYGLDDDEDCDDIALTFQSFDILWSEGDIR